MPLSATSPLYLHLLQNLSLIAICIFFTPPCTFIAICSHFASPYTKVAKQIQHVRKQRVASSSTSAPFRPPRVILVTGVGMSKGLAIARAFYRQGHTVIGADFEPYGIPVCGRFSAALSKFYKLSKPGPGPKGSRVYIDGLIDIIRRERVDLWVSCSGVASAIEDAEAAEAVEKQTRCKAIQFGVSITETLHEKHSFIQQAQSFGLNVPATHLITTTDTALAHLHPDVPRPQDPDTQYIMKSIGLDDRTRADMTLLPLPSARATRTHIARLRPSAARPFVLQEYIRGPEYCTHALVVRGRTVAFAACPSAALLMHYRALPPASALSRAMREYTERYARRLGRAATGHFSIDFVLGAERESGLGSASEDGAGAGAEVGLEGLLRRLYPIECNPRAHTAVLLFGEESEAMAGAYLSVLDKDDDMHASSERTAIVTPSTTATAEGYYWIGHDMITRVLLPFLSILTLEKSLSGALQPWTEYLERLAYWKDGTYEIWDPWPFWCLYCVYWPAMFCSVILTGRWWSRCNVSTTKMFRC